MSPDQLRVVKRTHGDGSVFFVLQQNYGDGYTEGWVDVPDGVYRTEARAREHLRARSFTDEVLP